MLGLPKIELMRGNDTLGLPKIELRKKAEDGAHQGRVNDANKDLFDLYERNSQSSARREF